MDKFTSEIRRKNMRAVKNKDSKIEILLRKELWRRGLRYYKNTNKVFGHPDIAFIRKKIAVFVDSEFWHGYDWENRKNDIHSNKDFWIPKIEKNIQRDNIVNNKLESDGWLVIRFWGKEIIKNTARCADIVEKAVNSNERA